MIINFDELWYVLELCYKCASCKIQILGQRLNCATKQHRTKSRFWKMQRNLNPNLRNFMYIPLLFDECVFIYVLCLMWRWLDSRHVQKVIWSSYFITCKSQLWLDRNALSVAWTTCNMHLAAQFLLDSSYQRSAAGSIINHEVTL